LKEQIKNIKTLIKKKSAKWKKVTNHYFYQQVQRFSINLCFNTIKILQKKIAASLSKKVKLRKSLKKEDLPIINHLKVKKWRTPRTKRHLSTQKLKVGFPARTNLQRNNPSGSHSSKKYQK